MRIICFGDSNTWGFDPRSYLGGRYPTEYRWVDRIGMQPGWKVINEGVNGREIPHSEGEYRCYLHMLKAESPDLIVIVLGGNDLLQGLRPESAALRMDSFLEMTVNNSNSRILLISPPLIREGTWVTSEKLIMYSRKIGPLYRKLAEKYGIDFADAGKWNIELTYDGVHYSEEGHIRFAEEIINLIKGMIENREYAVMRN